MYYVHLNAISNCLFSGMCGINNGGITDISKIFLMFILNPNIHEFKICLVVLRASCFLLHLQFYTPLYLRVRRIPLCKLNVTAFTVFQSDNGQS